MSLLESVGAWLPATRRAAAIFAAALLSACGSLPHDAARPVSTARVAPDDSPLARMVAAQSLPPERSGFQPMPLSGVSLQARLALIERAQDSIDLQTYLLGDDATGHQILRALRDAGARGVRVRVLVDDFHTAGMTELLLATAAQPGIELRLYNPFAYGRDSKTLRTLALLGDFERLNRRMHNKLFVADGRVAIVGGRNLADAYFMRDEKANFIDFDLLCAGPVAAELDTHFDAYWNSPHAFAVQALADDGRTAAQRGAAFDVLTAGVAAQARNAAPTAGVMQVQGLRSGQLSLIAAESTVYFDSPAKTAGGAPPQVLPIASQFGRAQASVLIVSPYFLPSTQGLQRMREARSRGVDIRIVTNAVVDSDEPLVGMAYGSRRVEMLRMGVHIFEFSSAQLKRDQTMRGALGDGVGRLHMKLALLDESTLLIGSFNLDPRSAGINTEMALRVRSESLSRQVLEALEAVRRDGLLELRLGDDGQTLQWVDAHGRVVQQGPGEPGLDGWQRLRLQLLLGLVPEELL